MYYLNIDIKRNKVKSMIANHHQQNHKKLKQKDKDKN